MKNFKIILFLSAISIFISSGCQTPLSFSRGTAVNKTNHDFLSETGVDLKTNPHKDGKCQVCHSAPDEILTKENAAETELIQRKYMRTDLIDLCVQCHKASSESEHRVGVGTNLNKNNLPLDRDSKVTCATTCHDVHTKDPSLRKNLLRYPPNTLCFSCHNV